MTLLLRPKHVPGKVFLPFHKHVRIVNADACIECKKCIRTCSHGVFIQLKDTVRR